MSGSTGADRIKSRQDFQQFLASYKDIISKFPGFVSIQPSGSYNSNAEKNDFGDIDLITHIKSTEDKKTVKLQLVDFFTKMPDNVIVPFTSAKYAGKKTYNSGEIVTIRYHDNQLGYSAQIDNIIALDHVEASFKQQFLDMAAPVQGLVLGLVKVATLETDPQILFQKLNIKAPALTNSNEEYEFNLSSIELQLRKVVYEPGTFKQINRDVIWKSSNYEDLQKLLYQYNLNTNFDNLLIQAKKNTKNPRSSKRIQGVFSSMITVKSGEVGTAKGDDKNNSLEKIKSMFNENRNSNPSVIFVFGRFQPPTIGHQKLINAAQNLALKNQSDCIVYVSKTQDKKNNPLPINIKMHFLNKMFPDVNFVAADEITRTPIEAVKKLNQNYKNLIMVVGSDRIDTFGKLLQDYNGKEYHYDTIQVVSAGERDPDSDNIEGMSGTKMRQAALNNDIASFIKGLPATMNKNDAKDLMSQIQQSAQNKLSETRLFNALTMPHLKSEKISEDIDWNNVPMIPVEDMLMEDVRQLMLEKPKLFENTKEYENLRNFIEKFKITPIIGKNYVCATIVAVPPYMITFASFDQPYELIAIKNQKIYLKIKDKVKQYPTGNQVTDDLLKFTLFFNSVQDLEKFKTVLSLKFSDWKLIYRNLNDQLAEKQTGMAGVGMGKYVVDQDNVNELDISTLSNYSAKRKMSDAPKSLRKASNHVNGLRAAKEKIQLKKTVANLKSKGDPRFSKDTTEQMLPKSAFTGSDKNKLGTTGQLRGQKRGTKAGDLVGSSESIEETKQRLDPKCWKGYKKSGTKMKGGKRVNNCVPIGESWEKEISSLVEQLARK